MAITRTPWLCIVIICSSYIVLAQEQCPDENDFRCRTNNQCINATLVCDKKFDCADHSDEEDCGKNSDQLLQHSIFMRLRWVPYSFFEIFH